MFELGDFLAGLEIVRSEEDRFRVPRMNYYGAHSGSAATSPITDLIAGGQLLAQSLQIAHELQPDKTARTLHAVFARTGRVSQELEAQVQTVNDGRTIGTMVITYLQQARPIATATVMTHAPDLDVIRHGAPRPSVPIPGEAGVQLVEGPFYDSGTVLESQLDGPDDIGPAELPTWVRSIDAPRQQHIQQGLVAFISNFPLVGVAMRPHAGLSAELSHLKVTTGVLVHTMSFHEEVDLSEWTMINYEVPSAGRGRYSGRGQVFTLDGEHVASFAQDGMIRALAEATTTAAGARL